MSVVNYLICTYLIFEIIFEELLYQESEGNVNLYLISWLWVNQRVNTHFLLWSWWPQGPSQGL